MKTYHNQFFTIVLLGFFGASALYGQHGRSTAGLAMGKMRAATMTVPAPDEIVMEDYLNYHKHAIALPGEGESVGLDLRWHTMQRDGVQEALFMVGLKTGKAASLADLPPVNLSLVIDKSGSMQGDRIAKSREAAHALAERLREGDIFSIVAFDHTVEIVLPAVTISDKRLLHQAIDRIIVSGSTDLHAGMIAGYEQVVQNHDPNYSNKVIMLTDALTNSGLTAPEEIVKNSKFYSEDYHVEFTIVGVGVDFNAFLAKQLTNSARSTLHFVNDPADIKKVFVDEIESLLAPVARNVQLEIEYDPALELRELYGYKPDLRRNKIVIELENLNGDMSQVVLCRFKMPADGQVNAAKMSVRLVYNEAFDMKLTRMEQVAEYPLRSRAFQRVAFANSELQKCYTIGQMASSYREMAVLFHLGKSDEAQNILRKSIAYTDINFPGHQDEDVERVREILASYLKNLKEYAARR